MLGSHAKDTPMNIDARRLRRLSLFAALLGGCAGDDGLSEVSKRPASADSADRVDPQEGPRLPPFSRPFDGLVQNTARWASFEVATKAARVERGMDEAWTDEEGDGAPIDPNAAYVEIDLEITNTTMFDDGLERRSTWDLVLPDGGRIKQTNVLGFATGPHGTIAFTLRHAVDDDFDLEGAVLELNGITRGELAPERIPLDAPYRADIDAVLEELQGKTFESARDASFDRRRLKVVTATVSRNSAVQNRSSYGKMFIELTLDLTCVGRSDNIFDDHFGIVVDGRLSRPVNEINELPEADTTLRIPVVFEIDDTAQAFTVRLQLGEDADLQPRVEWKDVQVRL